MPMVQGRVLHYSELFPNRVNLSPQGARSVALAMSL